MGSNSREAAARLTDMDTGHSGPSAGVTEGLEEEALLDGELEEGELEDGELADDATEETLEESEATEDGASSDGSAADGSEITPDSEAIAEATTEKDRAEEDSTEKTAEGEEELTEEELAEAEALAAAAAGGHQGPPTAIITGSANVFINGLPAARQGDMLAPHHPGTRTITEGSPSVLINGMPAARVTDAVDCGGTIETGSENVFIGNEPKLVPPTKVSLPDIVFKNRRASFKPKAITTQPPANTSSAQVDSVVYSPNSHSNNTNVRVEPVANNLGSVAWVGDASAGTTDTWGETYGKTLAAMVGDAAENQAELAKQTSGWGNVMQPLFKPVAGLGAAVGNTVGLLEGLSPHGLSPQVKNYWADQLASIKNVAKLISSAAKGNPTAAAQLTPAVITGLAMRKLPSGKPNDASKAQSKQTTKNHKFVNPQSFDEAKDLLAKARQAITDRGGLKEKYTQAELLELAADGEIKDKYIVRILPAKYLNADDGTELGGYLGQNNNGRVKYWSTTFDQIEANDTDPRAISQSVGIDYRPGTDYVMILIDREQAMAREGSYAMVPTYENLSAFAKQELADKLPHPELIDETLTKETSEKFLRDYQAMAPMSKKGAEDQEVQKEYFDSTGMGEREIKIFKNRLKLYEETGANEHYLGNGLTKNLNDLTGLKPYGVMETFSYDKNPMTIKQMVNPGNNVAQVIKLTPIPGVDI